MSNLYKFGWAPNGKDDEQYTHPHVWVRQTNDRMDRLEIAPRSGHISLLEQLSFCLDEPFLLLYVLVVPRSESEAGRYRNSKEFSFIQLRDFLHEYCDYLDKDGRHNLWIRPASGDGLLVYDRHNVIYAYGPVEPFIEVLKSAGLTQSSERFIQYASPHSHHYHPEFDGSERCLLSGYQWEISPLRPGDENP